MILITGATGFLGSNILGKLDSDKVKLLIRNKSSFLVNNKCYEGIIDSTTIYTEALQNVNCIIHCAARVHVMKDASINPIEKYREVNTTGTLNLARQAVEAGVKRFIFISSIKVNGEDTQIGSPFKATDKPNPQDPYGQSKAEAEEQLLALAKETGLEVVIIRPTLVYGAGVKANFASLMKLVAKGLPLPFGSITTNRRSLVSVYNLVDLIKTCIDHPNAANQVFLVSDDHDLSTADMVRQMGRALSKPTKLIPIPVFCYSLAGKITGKQDMVSRLIGSLQVDISATKKQLNWVPPYKLEDGFKMTANALLRDKK
ncbi:UDP-glucose 4-epimerase [Photobacterium phosphoreum]|uniref:UDP-glucose 4-epimerase family protein n=1 Tax=Photobacterium phosphoreum TaxID=659 RepID=UPI000D176F83|nr:SDR family oxidoreductase [Photobacterium phosphoreum]PSU68051.1 UDP-glucose 4-epimerase [Photobacterium phosphoreum]